MKSIQRTQFLASYLLAAAVAAAQPIIPLPYRPHARRVPDKPNIVLILADGLGSGELGCYGPTRVQTPNLDRLAAEGMRFTQCYAGSPFATASRFCLLTGLDTGPGGIRGNPTLALRAQDLTVAALLQQAGYRTLATGLWGLGREGTAGTPNRQGFNEWFGYLNPAPVLDYFPVSLSRNQRQYVLRGNLGGRRGDYAPDWFTRVATNFIRIEATHPFFLYFATPLPHANDALTNSADRGLTVPTDAPYARQPWPAAEKTRAAMITWLDNEVGQILAKLAALGLDNDTAVFFSSATGPPRVGSQPTKSFASTGPQRGFQGDLYEGGLRVPLIVRWPGRIQPGTVNGQPWALWDFLPTAAAIAGIQLPARRDGISMLPTLLGQPQRQTPVFLYWEVHEPLLRLAVRMGDWKALRLSPDQPWDLYNLKSDPGESQNVAAAHPEVLARIEAALKGARTGSPDSSKPNTGP